MSDRIILGAWVAFAVAILSPAALGAFAGGTGASNNRYQIATAEQLASIGSDPIQLAQCYVLVSDIDLDPYLPGGRVFPTAVIAPVGAILSPTYRGGGFTGKLGLLRSVGRVG